MTTTTTQDPCALFLDDLVSVIDGDDGALERHLDHLSSCDTCRDARHDAEAIARGIASAGADFVMPANMAAPPERALRTEPPPPAITSTTATPRSRRRVWIATAALAGVAAAAVTAVAITGAPDTTGQPTASKAAPGSAQPTTARLVARERAANDGAVGIEVRLPGRDDFSPATEAMELPAGAVIRTDERTRARLSLADGSELSLNHLTELALDPARPRAVKLSRGELVADVEHLDAGPTATFDLPTGRVEVLGTRFVLSAAETMSTVRVTRGLVRLVAGDGSAVEVRPGEEGAAPAGAPATVTPTANLASALAWSELLGDGQDQPADQTGGGIGELRAYKPGEKRDRDWPLVLERHKVSVRIVGNVARTEIEETFRNDSAVTLEGLYRFPLPADAGIDRLALDVDGKFEEGAFVEKDRATKIWTGVIHQATPKIKQQPLQEMVWVPGPWRDPALLEWKRGGRTELRIFPIPAKGARTVKIAYTQTLAPEGNARRYVYPLAHSSDGSTASRQFDVDIRLSGIDADAGVRAVGYDLAASKDGQATALTGSMTNFVPRGNLVVEYQLPDPSTELRAWTFKGAAAVAATRPTGKQGSAPELMAAQDLAAADTRPYALIALRPVLPRWSASERRDYILVVDSSQSMVGERTQRAIDVVTAVIGEMDRGDRFTLLACDVACRAYGDGPVAPSASAARDAAAWLREVEPGGASHIARAIRSAADLAGRHRGDRTAWILYIGDGVASIGPRRPAGLAAEIGRVAGDDIRVSTVGIGGDADSTALAAIARAGGGQFTPYVPGQRAEAAALAVLETTYGVSLRDAVVELPAGLTDVAPAKLPTVRAGEELLVAARFDGEIRGNVVLRGSVGGKPYHNEFPIQLAASTARGNAFVPRMWAALAIADLEQTGRAEDTARIVGLSKAFGVMSSHTSLLVLESEAMFRAFGVDRRQPDVRWTGDETDTEVVASGGLIGYGRSAGEAWSKDDRAPGDGAGADALADPVATAPAKAKPARKAPPTELRASDEAKKEASLDRRAPPRSISPPGRGPGMWMRRVFFTVGSVDRFDQVHPRIIQAVAAAETSLRERPDSRERHRALVQALSYAGELDRALDVARGWLERDRMDPEALIYIADLLGRQGKRDQALRMLSGIVDIRPDDAALQQRLADAQSRVGDRERECDHRIALAEIAGREPICSPAAPETVKGQLAIDASWLGTTDLDVSVITPQGVRVSWMGGRAGVTAIQAGDRSRERLALRRASRGNYLIEVSRTDPADGVPVRGTLEIVVHGTKRTLPFELTSARQTVGRVAVSRRSRLVAM